MTDKEIKALWAALDSLLEAGVIDEATRNKLAKRYGLSS